MVIDFREAKSARSCWGGGAEVGYAEEDARKVEEKKRGSQGLSG